MNILMNLREAAAYVGKTPQTLRRLVWAGRLQAKRAGNNSLVFETKDLDRLKATEYPEGMSHADIAARYSVGRTTVIYQFKRLGVKPIGVNRGGNHRTVYDPATVAKFAKMLGWVAGDENFSDMPPDPVN